MSTKGRSRHTLRGSVALGCMLRVQTLTHKLNWTRSRPTKACPSPMICGSAWPSWVWWQHWIVSFGFLGPFRLALWLYPLIPPLIHVGWRSKCVTVSCMKSSKSCEIVTHVLVIYYVDSISSVGSPFLNACHIAWNFDFMFKFITFEGWYCPNYPIQLSHLSFTSNTMWHIPWLLWPHNPCFQRMCMFQILVRILLVIL